MTKFKSFIVVLLTLLLGTIGAKAEDYNKNLIKGFQAANEGNYTEALKYYKQGAMEGDKYCCGRLAALYLFGIGTEANIPECRKWAVKGYELGNSFSAAVAGLSYVYEYGNNIVALNAALPYLEFAYNAEDREFDNAEIYASTAVNIAMGKMLQGNKEDAVAWIEQGIKDFPTFEPLWGQAAFAYWALEDYTKAVKYATMADKEDNLNGSFVLGWCMAHGKGITQNPEAGFKKIRKAATIGGIEYAMFALGECYYNGIGTSVNKQLAKEWFQKAADAGLEEAQEKLNILF